MTRNYKHKYENKYTEPWFYNNIVDVQDVSQPKGQKNAWKSLNLNVCMRDTCFMTKKKKTKTSTCNIPHNILILHTAHCKIYTLYLLRFDHQSGLDESSGRFLTFFLHGIAFSVYLTFS